jgi:hypothetical protein
MKLKRYALVLATALVLSLPGGSWQPADALADRAAGERPPGPVARPPTQTPPGFPGTTSPSVGAGNGGTTIAS